jgi:chromosome segregation ATPase
MPDVDERLDAVEQRLKDIGERMDERFAQVDQRFAQVDQRFAQVDQRFAQVDQRFGSLEDEVQKLRILGEQNTTDIKRIAEVQAHHGEVLAQHGAALQRLEEAIKPLSVLPAALQKILPDHERRIAALEQASSQSPREPS